MSGISPQERNKEIVVKPLWEDGTCTDGIWEHPTRGDGEMDKDDEQDANKVPINGHTGHFGIFAGNWGGKWKIPSEDDYMNKDIAKSVCQVILLQEVEPTFWDKMKKIAREKAESEGGAVGAELKPLFVGVKATKDPRETAF